MMGGVKRSAFALGVSLLIGGAALATPSTNIWNPSTDIQARETWHLGIDNYFSIVRNKTAPYAFGTDVGLTYGLLPGLEVGIDAVEPSVNPIAFNAKYGLKETPSMPALAVGIQALGNVRSWPMIGYALAAKNVSTYGRITAGGYIGQEKTLGEDNAGVILAWDRAFGSKWWASVDWSSGNNPYGALGVGGSYAFASNVSVIAGYVWYNDSAFNPNDTFTTQVDINF